MKPKALIVLLLGALCAGSASAQMGAKPKLVVNIVISQMRANYMDRFQDNFSADGFRRFMDQGAYFTDAHYNYMQTNTAAGLATLSTGTNPDGHGIVAEDWIDFTTNNPVNLIADPSVTGLDCDAGVGCYSPLNLTAATLGDRLKESDAKSKVVSIAATPVSAIVSGGHTADVFWMDAGRGHWISSTYYFKQLPTWVTAYNKQNLFAPFMERSWEPSKTLEGYKNSEHSVIDFTPAKTGFFSKPFFRKVGSIFKKDDDKFDAAALLYTPFGNSLTTQFAREAIVGEELGKDDHTDLLTIVYDTPRLIGEHFGPRSIELEDMYYKLDTELGILTDYLLAQFKPGEVVVVLTSDHGTSDTYKEDSRVPMGRFNAEQFKMIMNGFLSAQFEPGNWVIDYHDRQLYLNRSIIYSYGFNLAEVQTRAATFALQFRGVNGALSSTSMQNGYFGGGFGEKIQNSFYPKRSGDIVINLMPGWIEEDTAKVSLSGSLYDYDTHVPLMFFGANIPAQRIGRNVTMTGVTPTLARIMQITVPNASTGSVLPEVVPQQ